MQHDDVLGSIGATVIPTALDSPVPAFASYFEKAMARTCKQALDFGSQLL